MAVTFIAIVAAIAIPAFSKVKGKAETVYAKSTIRQLEIATKSYEVEYRRLPLMGSTSPSTGDQSSETTDPYGKALIETLLGKSTATNPRGISFVEFPPARASGAGYTPTSGLRDPWGKNGYRILLDANGDGTITNPEGGTGALSAPVAIYSAGPDGDFATWADNVCSWK